MDDRKLIESSRGGDHEAFGELLLRYRPQALAHARAILRSEADAEDAMQDASLDAFRNMEKFESGRRFYPWFYTLLRARCYKILGRRRRETQKSPDAAPLLLHPDGPQHEDVEACLNELNPEDRELLLLKHLDGLSYKQLAERLEIPDGTVMSRLYHARQNLKQKLMRRGAMALPQKETKP